MTRKNDKLTDRQSCLSQLSYLSVSFFRSNRISFDGTLAVKSDFRLVVKGYGREYRDAVNMAFSDDFQEFESTPEQPGMGDQDVILGKDSGLWKKSTHPRSKNGSQPNKLTQGQRYWTTCSPRWYSSGTRIRSASPQWRHSGIQTDCTRFRTSSAFLWCGRVLLLYPPGSRFRTAVLQSLTKILNDMLSQMVFFRDILAKNCDDETVETHLSLIHCLKIQMANCLLPNVISVLSSPGSMISISFEKSA